MGAMLISVVICSALVAMADVEYISYIGASAYAFFFAGED